MKINPAINIDSLGNVFYYGKDKIRVRRREKYLPYNITISYEYEKIFISKEAQIFLLKMNPYALSKCWALGLDPAFVSEKIIDQQMNYEFDKFNEYSSMEDLPFMELPKKKFIYTYSAKSNTIIDISFE